MCLVGLLAQTLWLAPSYGDNGSPPASPGLTPPLPGCAPPNIEETENSIVLRANQLEYLQGENRLIASGEVSVTRGKTRILADHLNLNTETGIGTAEGNVRLLTPDEDVQASRLDFNLSSERGLLYDSKGMLAKTYRIAGERIERLDERRFVVQGGRITGCTGLIPDWEFRSRHSRITLEDYVVMREPSLWIKGVPVFYLPYFILPIKKERATGFLPPHVGFSEDDGEIVGTQFFWAMTEWMDSTIGLEYLTNKGLKPEVEWRYLLDPLSDGKVQGAFIQEKDTGDFLWRMLLQQRQEFGWGIRGISQIDLRSERDLLRRFSRSLREESAIRTASFAALTKHFTDASLTLSGDSFDGIPASGSIGQQFRRIPTLRFDHFATPLFGPAYFSVEGSYSRLSDPNIMNNTEVQRLDLFPQVTVPLSLAPWLRFTAMGGVRETLYDHRVTGNDQGERTLAELRANMEGPALWRRYPLGTGGGTLIHLIETRLGYRYIPAREQGNLPAFETLTNADEYFLDPLETRTFVDRIAAVNYAKLAVVQHFLARTSTETGVGSLRQVARIVVSQGFDFQEATTGNGRLFGPLDVDMEMRIWQPWWLEASLRFDMETSLLQEIRWRGNVTFIPGWTLSLENYQRRDPDINYVLGGLQASIIGGLSVGYNARYDAKQRDFREHQLSLTYVAQCWFVTLSYRMREAGDTDFFIRGNILNF